MSAVKKPKKSKGKPAKPAKAVAYQGGPEKTRELLGAVLGAACGASIGLSFGRNPRHFDPLFKMIGEFVLAHPQFASIMGNIGSVLPKNEWATAGPVAHAPGCPAGPGPHVTPGCFACLVPGSGGRHVPGCPNGAAGRTANAKKRREPRVRKPAKAKNGKPGDDEPTFV